MAKNNKIRRPGIGSTLYDYRQSGSFISPYIETDLNLYSSDNIKNDIDEDVSNNIAQDSIISDTDTIKNELTSKSENIQVDPIDDVTFGDNSINDIFDNTSDLTIPTDSVKDTLSKSTSDAISPDKPKDKSNLFLDILTNFFNKKDETSINDIGGELVHSINPKLESYRAEYKYLDLLKNRNDIQYDLELFGEDDQKRKDLLEIDAIISELQPEYEQNIINRFGGDQVVNKRIKEYGRNIGKGNIITSPLLLVNPALGIVSSSVLGKALYKNSDVHLDESDILNINDKAYAYLQTDINSRITNAKTEIDKLQALQADRHNKIKDLRDGIKDRYTGNALILNHKVSEEYLKREEESPTSLISGDFWLYKIPGILGSTASLFEYQLAGIGGAFIANLGRTTAIRAASLATANPWIIKATHIAAALFAVAGVSANIAANYTSRKHETYAEIYDMYKEALVKQASEDIDPITNESLYNIAIQEGKEYLENEGQDASEVDDDSIMDLILQGNIPINNKTFNEYRKEWRNGLDEVYLQNMALSSVDVAQDLLVFPWVGKLASKVVSPVTKPLGKVLSKVSEPVSKFVNKGIDNVLDFGTRIAPKLIDNGSNIRAFGRTIGNIGWRTGSAMLLEGIGDEGNQYLISQKYINKLNRDNPTIWSAMWDDLGYTMDGLLAVSGIGSKDHSSLLYSSVANDQEYLENVISGAGVSLILGGGPTILTQTGIVPKQFRAKGNLFDQIKANNFIRQLTVEQLLDKENLTKARMYSKRVAAERPNEIVRSLNWLKHSLPDGITTDDVDEEIKRVLRVATISNSKFINTVSKDLGISRNDEDFATIVALNNQVNEKFDKLLKNNKELNTKFNDIESDLNLREYVDNIITDDKLKEPVYNIFRFNTEEAALNELIDAVKQNRDNGKELNGYVGDVINFKVINEYLNQLNEIKNEMQIKKSEINKQFEKDGTPFNTDDFGQFEGQTGEDLKLKIQELLLSNLAVQNAAYTSEIFNGFLNKKPYSKLSDSQKNIVKRHIKSHLDKFNDTVEYTKNIVDSVINSGTEESEPVITHIPDNIVSDDDQVDTDKKPAVDVVISTTSENIETKQEELIKNEVSQSKIEKIKNPTKPDKMNIVDELLRYSANVDSDVEPFISDELNPMEYNDVLTVSDVDSFKDITPTEAPDLDPHLNLDDIQSPDIKDESVKSQKESPIIKKEEPKIIDSNNFTEEEVKKIASIEKLSQLESEQKNILLDRNTLPPNVIPNSGNYSSYGKTSHTFFYNPTLTNPMISNVPGEVFENGEALGKFLADPNNNGKISWEIRVTDFDKSFNIKDQTTWDNAAIIMVGTTNDGNVYSTALKTPQGALELHSTQAKSTPEIIQNDIENLRSFRNKIIETWIIAQQQNAKVVPSVVSISNGLFNVNRTTDSNGIQRSVQRPILDVKGFEMTGDIFEIDKGNVILGIGKGIKDDHLIFDKDGYILEGTGGSGRIYIYPKTPSGKPTPIQLNERRFNTSKEDEGLVDLIFDLLVYYGNNRVDQVQAIHNGKKVDSGFTPADLLRLIINHGESTLIAEKDRETLKFLLPKQLNFDQSTQTVQIGDYKYNRQNLLNNENLKSEFKNTIRNNFHWTIDKQWLWERIGSTIDIRSFFRAYNTDTMVIVPGVLEFHYTDVGLTKTDTGKYIVNDDNPYGISWIAWYAKNGILQSDLQDVLFKNPFIYVDDVKLEIPENISPTEPTDEFNDALTVIPEADGTITTSTEKPDIIDIDKISDMSIDDILAAATAGNFDIDENVPDITDIKKKLGIPNIIGKRSNKNLINVDKAKKNLNRILGLTDEDIEITDKVIEIGHDLQASGLMREDSILLWEGAEEGVEYHEAFHRVNLLLTSEEEREKIYNSFRKRTKDNLSDKVVEENLAEGFREFMGSKSTRFGYLVKKLFNKFFKFIGAYRLISDTTILDLYNDIKNGVYKDANINLESLNRFKEVYSDASVPYEINTEKGPVKLQNFPSLSDVFNTIGSLKQLLFTSGNIQKVEDLDTIRGHKSLLKYILIKEIGNTDKTISQRKAIAEIVKHYETIFWPLVDSEIEHLGIRDVDLNEYSRQEELEKGNVRSGEIGWNDKSAMQISKKDNALLGVKFFIGTMPEVEWTYVTNPNGTESKVLSEVSDPITGFVKSIDFDTAWNLILENLYNSSTKEELLINLNKLSDKPFFAALNNRLTNDTIDETLETQIIQTIYSNKLNMFYISYGKDYLSEETNPKTTFRVGDSNLLRAVRLYPMSWNSNFFNISGIVKKESGEISINSKKLLNIIKEYNDLVSEVSLKYNEKSITDRELIKYKKNLVDILNKIGINIDVDVIDTLLNNFDNLSSHSDYGKFYRFLTNVHAKSINKLFNTTLNNIANGESPTTRRGKIKINLSLDDFFKYESIIKAIAESYALVHPRPEELSVLGADGNLLYPITEHNYISNLIDRLNKPAIEGQKYNDLLTKLGNVTYAGNSIILEHLRAKNKLTLNTFANFIEESSGDRGRDYLSISSIEDYLSKMTLVANDHIILPTMADKPTYHTITGIPLKHERITIERDGIFYTSKLNNKILDIFDGYAFDEWNTIKKYYSTESQQILKENPDRVVENYHTKNRGGRFRNFTGIWLNVNGESEFTDLNKLLDDYENGNVPGQTVYDAISLIDQQFFNKDSQFRYMVYNDILKQRILDEIRTAEKFNLINVVERKDSKLPILTNRLLDQVKYEELVEHYKNSTDPELSNYASSYAIFDMLADFTINTQISVNEFGKVFMKDPAFYKNTDDMIKRYGGLLSTGKNLRTEWDADSDMVGTTTYTVSELNDNIIKSQQFDELVDLFTKAYSKETSEKNARILALRDLAGYENINQADGSVYISPRMYKNISRMLGKFPVEVEEAFNIMESDGDWSSDPEKYLKAIKTLINPLKMTSFNDIFDPELGLNIPIYDKMALFPMFKLLATGDNSELYDRMTGQGKYFGYGQIDMVKMSSAVKVGSRERGNFYNDKEMTSISDLRNLRTYKQEFDNLREQLSTEPHTEERRLLGTQASKMALANIDLDHMYNNGMTGSQIRDEVFGCMNALSNIGASEFIASIGDETASGINIDINKLSKLLSENAKKSKLPNDVLNGLKVKDDKFSTPISAMSDSKWIESMFISLLNKKVIDINLPGGAYIQMSSFGFKSISGIKDSAVNKGKRQLFLNDDGSMDAIVSINLFKHVLPKNLIDFKSQKQWLIDAGIIGDNSGVVAMGYRIPTQGNNSTVALRVVDVLEEVIADTIILPDEFTTLNGSDFDIDKLFVARYNYDKNGKKIEFDTNIENTQKWENDFNKLKELGFDDDYINNLISIQKSRFKTKFELNSKEAVENRLLDMYLAVLTDPSKITETRLPLDNITSYLKDDILKNVDGQNINKRPQPFYELSPTFQLNKKYEYTIGKNGIAPMALNSVNHVLTQLMNVNFKNNPILGKFGIFDLNKVYSNDVRMIKILDWLSALINAHVDVAKDSYIIRFNIVPWTYNMTTMLFRAGMGENVFYFLPQNILKDIAIQFSIYTGRYGIDQTKSAFRLEEEAIKIVYDDYYNKAKALAKTSNENDMLNELDKVDERGNMIVDNSYVLKNSSYLLEQLEKGRKEQKDFLYYYNQLLIYKTYEQLVPFALGLNELVQKSQIDTKKAGNNFILQKNYVYGIKKNILDNKVFPREVIRNYYKNSFMDTKIRNGLLLGKELLKDHLLRANDSFINQHDYMMLLLGYTDTKDELLINDISNILEGSIKSGFFQKFLKDNNINPYNYYYGNNSIGNRLLKIKSDIISGKYPEMLNESGRIKNDFLNFIESRPGSEKYDGFYSPDFITTNVITDRDIYLQDKLKLYFDELLNSPHVEIRNFAKDLVMFAFITSADNPSINNIFKFVPLSYRNSLGYSKYMDDVMDRANRGILEVSFDDIFKNNWFNGKIVPDVKFSNTYFSGSIGDYVTKTLPHIMSNHNLYGTNIKYPIIFINQFAYPIGENNAGEMLFKPYVKINITRDTNPTTTVLYKHVGNFYTDDRISPVYIAVHKKGIRQNGIVATEYDGYSNSLFAFNNLPIDYKFPTTNNEIQEFLNLTDISNNKLKDNALNIITNTTIISDYKPIDIALKYSYEELMDLETLDNLGTSNKETFNEITLPVDESIWGSIDKASVENYDNFEEAKIAAEDEDSIWTMRPNKDIQFPKNQHYGNPWSSQKERLAKGVIVVGSIDEAVENYYKWLTKEDFNDIETERRDWILDQINSGKLFRKKLIYYKPKGKDYYSHADVLEKLVEDRTRIDPDSRYVKEINYGFESKKLMSNNVEIDNVASNPSELSLHSGGAIGADTEWSNIAIKYGMDKSKAFHYYYGKKTPNGTYEISIEDFNEGKEKVYKANEKLNRRIEKYVDFLASNWAQVKHSDAVYAISTIDFKRNIVNGGTGWAVQMAIDAKKQIFVYDQRVANWYTYNYNDNKFERLLFPPKLTKKFAGIGSRELTNNGLKAIESVFEETFGEADTQSNDNIDVVITNPIKVERSDKIISRKDVQENPNTLYIFGDNDIRRGLGGQAKQMRGEPNAIGISTKKLPSNALNAFKTDAEFEQNAKIITEDVNKVIKELDTGKYNRLVIPPIGVGLAKLPERAPKTWEYLQNELRILEEHVNDINNKLKTSKKTANQTPSNLDTYKIDNVEVTDQKFDPDMAPDGGTRIILIDGNYAGEFAVLETDDEIRLSGSIGANTNLEKEYRGKGYGTKAYIALANIAKNKGKVLRSDDNQTESAENVWKRFEEKGYAEKIVEKPFEDSDYTNTYYRIINDKLPKDIEATIDNSGAILFNSQTPTYSMLSNFANTPFVYEGLEYPTAEHAFQAAKTTDNTLKEAFTTKYNISPQLAKFGGNRLPLRENWDNVKESVMFSILLEKFTQNQESRDLLMSTGDSKLIHDTSNRNLFKVNDDFWGNGWDGTGMNVMGTVLMTVREFLTLKQSVTIPANESNINKLSNENIITVGGEEYDISKIGIHFTLNDSQIETINSIHEWINSTNAYESPAYTISGAAGTGKSTIMKIVAYIFSKDFDTIVPVAPTHAARKVLVNYLGNFSDGKGKTIHSFLGLRPDVDIEKFNLSMLQFAQTGKVYSEVNPLIIADESSMINDPLSDAMVQHTQSLGGRILFVGDSAQLNPVNQDTISKIFTGFPTSVLNIIERQKSGNPLLTALSIARNHIENTKEQYPRYSTEFNEFGKGIVIAHTYGGADSSNIVKFITDLLKSDEFKTNPNLVRWLSYRNDVVFATNNAIRQSLNYTESIVEGELLKAYSKFGAEIENSDEFIVSEILEKNSTINLRSIFGGEKSEIVGDFIELDSGEEFINVTLVSDPNSIQILRSKLLEYNQNIENALDELYEDVLNGNITKQMYFKQMREIQKGRLQKSQALAVMAPIYGTLNKARHFGKNGSIRSNQNVTLLKKTFDYGYASTVHKAQGSTYKYVIINYEDLLLNKDRNERMRLIYTAMSRPTDAAILLSKQASEGQTFQDFMNTTDNLNNEYDDSASKFCRGK